jgi:hypothetical protein
MLKGRRALIGYVTYFIGKRVLRRVVKKQGRKRLARFLDAADTAPSRRRKLPLIGAGLALAAGAVALVARARRESPRS